MAIPSGTYTLGPSDGELLVHTGRQGAAAKAGHDLEMVVTQWSATLEIGEEPSLTLSADSSSLRVRAGHGGIQALDEGDKENIAKTIDDEVLKRTPIEFRSTAMDGDLEGGSLRVQGELELMGRRRPLGFELTVEEDGRLKGSAVIKQSDWGIKQYAILFGTIKVADEVTVTIEGNLKG